MWSYCDRQCHHPSGVYLVSIEINEEKFERPQSFGIHFQLLESRKVDKGSKVAIIYKTSSSVESFYHKNDIQGVVMWLLHPFGVFLWKQDVYACLSSLFQGRHPVDTIYMSLL